MKSASFLHPEEQEGHSSLFTYLKGVPAVFLPDHQQMMLSI